eukprot:jgi/Picsp_1/1003/NSC_04487-R1_---NA---
MPDIERYFQRGPSKIQCTHRFLRPKQLFLSIQSHPAINSFINALNHSCPVRFKEKPRRTQNLSALLQNRSLLLLVQSPHSRCPEQKYRSTRPHFLWNYSFHPLQQWCQHRRFDTTHCTRKRRQTWLRFHSFVSSSKLCAPFRHFICRSIRRYLFQFRQRIHSLAVLLSALMMLCPVSQSKRIHPGPRTSSIYHQHVRDTFITQP